MAERIERRALRKLRANLAAVGRRLAEAEAALQRESALRPRVRVDVDAVEALILVAEVVSRRDVVVGQAEQRRVDVVQWANRLTAAAGQPRVGRRRHVERAEVGRRHREVIRGDEALEPAADVAHFDRDARQDFLLHRDTERPVGRPRAPALEDGRVDRVAEHALAEVRVRERAAHVSARRAQVLRVGIQEVAVGREVAVVVGPVSRDVRDDARRRVGDAVIRRGDRRLEILADVALDRRLAVPEHVPRRGHARREILVAVDAGRLGIDERRRQERRRAFLLFRRPAPGAVEAHAALQRDAVDRPLSLREQRIVAHPEIVLEVVDEHRQLVRDAVVEAVAQRVRSAVGRADVAELAALIADLQAVRAVHERHRGAPRGGRVLVAAVAEEVDRL